ncbi:MAG: YcxB family protein [Ahrensia sp.]|nr:YcxB family protein [Ahrensia sp.]
MENNDQPIEAAFFITKQDYLVLNKALQKKKKNRTVWNYVGWAVLFLLLIFYIFLMSYFSGLSLLGAVLIFGSLALVSGGVAYRFTPQLNTFLFYKGYRVDKNEMRARFSEEEFYIETDKVRGTLQWTAFVDLMRTQNHFLFWVNPMMAHVIPFRALGKADIERVWDMIKELPTAREFKV